MGLTALQTEGPLAAELDRSRESKRGHFAAMLLLLPIAMEGILQLLTVSLAPVAVVLTGTRPEAVPRWLDDAELVYRPNPAHPDHDDWGFRNEQVPERADIVVLGDSQTYGAGVLRSEAWPKQLAAVSDKTVYSISCGGHGPTQSLMLLDKALELEPDWVVEAVYAGNDLFDCYHLVHGMGGLPDLATRDEQARAEIAAAEARETLLGQVTRVSGAASTGLKGWLRDHSRLYGLARATRDALRGPVDGTDWPSMVAAAARSGGRDEAFQLSAEIRTTFTPAYRLCALDQSDPRLLEGRRIMEECLRRMQARVEQAGARFVVLLVPTKELVFREVVRQSGYGSETFRRVTNNELTFWDALRKSLQARGIAHVDALPALRAQVQQSLAPYPMSNDGHPNPVGHRAIAECVLEVAGGHE